MSKNQFRNIIKAQQQSLIINSHNLNIINLLNYHLKYDIVSFIIIIIKCFWTLFEVVWSIFSSSLIIIDSWMVLINIIIKFRN